MDSIRELTVRELLSQDDYRIPIYQRNYAWGMPEVSQLIQDVADYAKEGRQDYHIGNLIVFQQDDSLETIDGQQRLTTLTILMCAVRNHFAASYPMDWYRRLNISFIHRDGSNSILRNLFNGDDGDMEGDIYNVYRGAWVEMERICRDSGIAMPKFLDYFLDRVKILRVRMPDGTNLNHYFEIMNSRGEQLEPHEIIKAQLMQPFKDDPELMAAFDTVWEACANMNRYVQMNFTKDIRRRLFDFDGSGLLNAGLDFDAIVQVIGQVREKTNKAGEKDMEEESLLQLFADDDNHVGYKKPWEESKSDDDDEESYHSVITFPNFLLHVLKAMYPTDPDITLDDKKLVATFGKFGGRRDFSERFIVKLLKLRNIFDHYVVKRNQDGWRLQSLVRQDEDHNKYYLRGTFAEDANRRLVMLEAMFHVSTPTQNYKWWLFAVLSFLDRNDLPLQNDGRRDASPFISYLESLAKAYMLDRYLAAKPKDPEVIIVTDVGRPQNDVADAQWPNINIDGYSKPGEKVENFVFNYYDYLLWREQSDADFEFAYRTSVEHFYPQHPTNLAPMAPEPLNSFGNLCLISRGMNSKFSNLLPGSKVDTYGSPEMMKGYSLKLQRMMERVRAGAEWNEETIEQESQAAKRRLQRALEQAASCSAG